MKSLKTITILTIAAIFINACGSSQAANDKLAELQAKKDQLAQLQTEVKALETELIESGELEVKINRVLVTALTMNQSAFIHKIEARGAVESRKNVTLMAEAMGRITAIKVSEGQTVKKGQLLINIDATVLKNSLAEVRTGLELATVVYERQKNLWEKNIGTEIQFLQAKNNKESLERKLTTLESQLRMYNIYAPFDGVVDLIPVKVGEMAQPGVPMLRMVNPNSMYLSAEVSEAFMGKFSKGDVVDVYFPSQDENVKTTIASVGQVINAENRTFKLEIDLPNVKFPVKANQVAVLNLKDYENPSAFVIPTKLIQRDSRGQFVYEIADVDGILVARKAHVETGLSYNNQTEITSGLKSGQRVVLKGYRELSPNALIEVTK